MSQTMHRCIVRRIIENGYLETLLWLLQVNHPLLVTLIIAATTGLSKAFKAVGKETGKVAHEAAFSTHEVTA